MKYIVLLLALVVGLWTGAYAQNKKGATPATTKAQDPVKSPAESKPPINILGEHFARKHFVANRWSDDDVAKSALYDLIVEYPNNDSLIFALAKLYYENQKYPSCVMVCNDLLGRNPKNAAILELSGESYENLNINDRALQSYESLFLLTNNNATLYKMASLQNELKRYQETMTNIDILLTKPEVETLKVVFNDAENKPKEYNLKAALFNLKGLVYKVQDDKVNAKKYFEDALKLEPEFLLAKQNLAALK